MRGVARVAATDSDNVFNESGQEQASTEPPVASYGFGRQTFGGVWITKTEVRVGPGAGSGDDE